MRKAGYGNLLVMLTRKPGVTGRVAREAGVNESDLIAGACGYRTFTLEQRTRISDVMHLRESWLFDPFASIPSARGAAEKAVEL